MKKILENIGGLAWLLMDIFWMSNITFAAYIAFFIAIFIHSFIIPKNRTVGAGSGYVATLCWLAMNGFWMFDETTSHIIWIFTFFKYTFMVLGLLFVCLVLITDGIRLNNIRRFK